MHESDLVDEYAQVCKRIESLNKKKQKLKQELLRLTGNTFIGNKYAVVKVVSTRETLKTAEVKKFLGKRLEKFLRVTDVISLKIVKLDKRTSSRIVPLDEFSKEQKEKVA